MIADLEIVKVASVQVSTARRVLTAQLVAEGAEGDDNAAALYDASEIAQPLGVMASPEIATTTEALALRRGDELIAVVVIDKGAASQNVEAGETRLYGAGYSNATATVRIMAAGDVRVTPATSRDVVLAGGTLEVARRTDPVSIDATLALWVSQVTTAVNGLAPGSVTAVPGSTVGTIASGAPNVKA